jgi:hypothetical protein
MVIKIRKYVEISLAKEDGVPTWKIFWGLQILH